MNKSKPEAVLREKPHKEEVLTKSPIREKL
jgi:hypothetical protein